MSGVVVDIKLINKGIQTVIDGLILSKKKIEQVVPKSMLKLVRNCFNRSIDPNGKPWDPLKIRKGNPLVDTSNLKFSIRAYKNTLSTRVPYSATHQFGATINPKNKPYLHFKAGGRWFKLKRVVIPERPFLPGDNLPQAWWNQIKTDIESSLKVK